MPRRGYSNFALPKDLVVKIDRYLERNTWGYRSRAEVITAAVREFLERQEKEEREAPPGRVAGPAGRP